MNTIDELRSILDDGALARFLALFAGTDLTFPKSRRGTFYAELARIIGADAADKVCRRWAGESVYIPRGSARDRDQRDEMIAARLAAGESPESIARSFYEVRRLSVRTVRRIAVRAGSGPL